MIERYTIKTAPAVNHKDIMKRLDEMKEFDPAEMKKLQHLKVKVDVICEADDLKRITDLLKELNKPYVC
jgi:hypothetical protein